jgi:ABC-2 type transport system ATP-binding protein
MAHVIEASRLTRRFGAVEAVHDLDLGVPGGRVVAFLGRNGAGKTTTIKLLAGLLRPTRGESRLLGTPSSRLGAGDWARIGYVSENQVLYGWMTGHELLDFARPLYPTWDRDLEGLLVRRLSLDLRRRVRQASRGERMKLALVLGLAFRPKLLLLDEPFSGLDPLACEELLGGLLEVTAQSEWSVFISTQDVDEAERLADDLCVIDRGRLLLSESIGALQSRFRRVHVALQAPLDARFDWPEAMETSSTESALEFVDPLFSREREAELRRRFPDAAIEIRPMSLRDVFVAVARRAAHQETGRA